MGPAALKRGGLGDWSRAGETSNGFCFHDLSRKAERQMIGLKPPDLSNLVGRLDAELKQNRQVGMQFQCGAPQSLPQHQRQMSPRPQMPAPAPAPVGIPKSVPAPDHEDPVDHADLVASPTVSALRRREEMESRRSNFDFKLAIPATKPQLGPPLAFAPPNSPRLEQRNWPSSPTLCPRYGQPNGSPSPSLVPQTMRAVPSPYGLAAGSLQAPPGPALLSPRDGSLRAPSPSVGFNPSVLQGRAISPGRAASPGRAPLTSPSPLSFSRSPLAEKAREAVSKGMVAPEAPGAALAPSCMTPAWSRGRNPTFQPGSARGPLGGYPVAHGYSRVGSPPPRGYSPGPAMRGPGRGRVLPRWGDAPEVRSPLATSAILGTSSPQQPMMLATAARLSAAAATNPCGFTFKSGPIRATSSTAAPARTSFSAALGQPLSPGRSFSQPEPLSQMPAWSAAGPKPAMAAIAEP